VATTVPLARRGEPGWPFWCGRPWCVGMRSPALARGHPFVGRQPGTSTWPPPRRTRVYRLNLAADTISCSPTRARPTWPLVWPSGAVCGAPTTSPSTTTATSPSSRTATAGSTTVKGRRHLVRQGPQHGRGPHRRRRGSRPLGVELHGQTSEFSSCPESIEREDGSLPGAARPRPLPPPGMASEVLMPPHRVRGGPKRRRTRARGTGGSPSWLGEPGSRWSPWADPRGRRPRCTPGRGSRPT